MRILSKTAKAAAALSLVFAASQAGAHFVETSTVAIPSLSPGESHEIIVDCGHHRFLVSGGFAASELAPLTVTAAHPVTTRSYRVEVTNGGGRPTTSFESSLVVANLCGYRH